MMKYKKYAATAAFDADAKTFFGRVLNVRDVLTFEGTSVKALEKAFRDTVEDYLASCAERGEKPERPYTGEPRLRMDPDLHRRAALSAEARGKSLNRFMIDALESATREH